MDQFGLQRQQAGFTLQQRQEDIQLQLPTTGSVVERPVPSFHVVVGADRGPEHAPCWRRPLLTGDPCLLDVLAELVDGRVLIVPPEVAEGARDVCVW